MIRLGILGVGRWGPNLLRNFKALPDATVELVVDLDATRLDAIRQAFPEVRTAREPDLLLDADNLDAVVVATPTRTHYELVKAALSAGKHVMVEKPLAPVPAQCKELHALAEQQNRVLLVGHIFLFNPAIQAAKAELTAGRVGQLFNLSLTRTNLGPVRMDVHAGWDLISHDLSIVNWWLDANPVEVSAVGHAWINPDLPDAVWATFAYPNGVMCHVEASWLHPKKQRQVAVVGSRGMLTVDDLHPTQPVVFLEKRVTDETTSPPFVEGKFRISTTEGSRQPVEVARGEPLRAECEEFLACIRDGRKPLSDGAFATRVVTALAALDDSLKRRGAPVSIKGS